MILQQKKRLPRLTNAQFDYVKDLAHKSGKSLTRCPTCGTRAIHIDDDTYGWENGTYKLDGEVYQCDCDIQIELMKHYYLANIGDQYQRLDWKSFQGSQDAKDAVELYLENWENIKKNGLGLEFSSTAIGVGKTFSATYLARELVKRGESVFFIPFLDIVHSVGRDNTELEDRIRYTNILILDEVVPAISEAQRQFFSGKFEELIRHRTNFNLPTIMTTNMTPDQLHKDYPRIYSLLEAKQIRIEMNGEDARRGTIANINLSRVLNDEISPIS